MRRDHEAPKGIPLVPHNELDCPIMWTELARLEDKATRALSETPQFVETAQNMLKEAYDMHLDDLASSGHF